MKRKIWQAFVVAGLLLFLSRTAVQRDLQASAFQEKIEQCLKAGELPIVVLSQESGEYESLENQHFGRQNMLQLRLIKMVG